MRKLNKDEINAIVELAKEMQIKHGDYRKGQAFFNALYMLHPDVADKIRATDKDPFYNDKIVECVKYISE